MNTETHIAAEQVSTGQEETPFISIGDAAARVVERAERLMNCPAWRMARRIEYISRKQAEADSASVSDDADRVEQINQGRISDALTTRRDLLADELSYTRANSPDGALMQVAVAHSIVVVLDSIIMAAVENEEPPEVTEYVLRDMVAKVDRLLHSVAGVLIQLGATERKYGSAHYMSLEFDPFPNSGGSIDDIDRAMSASA